MGIDITEVPRGQQNWPTAKSCGLSSKGKDDWRLRINVQLASTALAGKWLLKRYVNGKE